MKLKGYLFAVFLCLLSMQTNAFEVTSPSVVDGKLPIRYGHDSGLVLGLIGAQDISPSVSWSNVPVGTTSFTLKFTDLNEQIGGIDVLHWSLSNIPVGISYIPEDLNNNTFAADNNISVNCTDLYDPDDLALFPGPAYLGPHPDYADVDNDLTHNYRLTLEAIGAGDVVLKTATFDMSFTSENLVDDMAPVITGDSVKDIYSNTVTLCATSDEDATAYFVVIPFSSVDDPDPSSSQVIAGRNANNQLVATSGTDAMLAGIPHGFNLTGLSPDTSYGVHLAVRDANGNTSLTQKFFFTSSEFELDFDNSSPIALTEGNSKAFQVSLSAPPSADLTMNVVASDEDRLFVADGTTLTFTMDNYYIPQEVVIVADFDDDDVDSTIWVDFTVTSGYDSLIGNPWATVDVTDVIVPDNETLLNYQPGWNLICLPYNTQTVTGLEPIENYLSAAWNWNSLSARYELVAKDTVLTPGVGYWVYLNTILTEANTIMTDAKVEDQDISLTPGWNLKGVITGTLVADISGYQGSIWRWDNIRARYQQVTGTLKPGIGYWFYADNQ